MRHRVEVRVAVTDDSLPVARIDTFGAEHEVERAKVTTALQILNLYGTLLGIKGLNLNTVKNTALSEKTRPLMLRALTEEEGLGIPLEIANTFIDAVIKGNAGVAVQFDVVFDPPEGTRRPRHYENFELVQHT